MESTRRLLVELPKDMADAVEARVSDGECDSVSEVIQEGLRALAERDDELLRDPARQVVIGYIIVGDAVSIVGVS